MYIVVLVVCCTIVGVNAYQEGYIQGKLEEDGKAH